MARDLQSREKLRPVDLARRHGLSTQAVRNYEEAGILPAADRTAHGYRTYTPLHARALDAFLALLPGHGHRTASGVMRAVNEGAVGEALRLIDESHVQLLDDRRTLAAVEGALRDLAAGPGLPAGAAPATGGRFIGPLARELGIRPATLRKWERAGVVRPPRDPLTGYRVYGEADVRDARLAHQLRRGGYPLARIAPVLEQVRSAGGPEPLEATLRDWQDRVDARGRALLAGAAELEAYLRARDGQRRKATA
ncbi:TioE family transcriptional regulator [Streptomyces parvulus]|uniref:TioE family transcriptional regulator n=1 Tax=Streptomyces parvulus TaxID=146923 RepID=A0ABV5D3T1_9ACTN|nr:MULTISPECIES: TioE family transcriptional regulator [Streptomyces]MCC9156746.1 TioE family transcriptional regulator [Streptomyces parvulus]MCE7686032.1 TioE family transcriptional regulator [Streptomyces parvulus]WML82676.1 TioE family transcriptional regulator [Streptomyces sp. VNUA74]